MACSGVVILVLVAVFLPIALLVTYGVSVLLGHVAPVFPYISDTGTFPPESCIFGILIGCYAMMSVVAVYIRYRQVALFYTSSGRHHLRRANIVGFVLGELAALGAFVVANFQETNVLEVHLIGASMAFGLISIYFWIQTGVTFTAREIPGYLPCVCFLRLLLMFLHTGSCVLVTVMANVASGKLALSSIYENGTKFNWAEGDPGFPEHLAATISEWAIALFTILYFLTFWREFRQFRILSPPIKFVGSGGSWKIEPAKEMKPVSTITCESPNGITATSNGMVVLANGNTPTSAMVVEPTNGITATSNGILAVPNGNTPTSAIVAESANGIKPTPVAGSESANGTLPNSEVMDERL